MKTKLVGILNLTPDSFSDGGQFLNVDSAYAHAEQMIKDGADIIDIGAESTRPGAVALSAEQEWQRLEPVLNSLAKLRPAGGWSLDTLHPENIDSAISILGPLIINNVAGFHNPQMVQIAAQTGMAIIVSHLPLAAAGNIQAAHKSIQLIASPRQVLEELNLRVAQLEAKGVKLKNIILDPGIGFGKTPECNRSLLKFSEMTNFPVMIGYSRKRFLGQNRMDIEPNLEAGRVAIESGAAYLRVHDVAAHRKMLQNLKNQ